MTREEAIERIKSRYDKWALDDKDLEAFQYIFPDLKESEDERMINELQGFLSSFGSDYFGTGEWQKFDDWLEKQKEQKPAKWSEEDEDMRYKATAVLNKLCASQGEFVWSHSTLVKVFHWLNHLHPSWKPSEEQMRVLLKANPVNLMPEELSVYNSLCNDIQKLM